MKRLFTLVILLLMAQTIMAAESFGRLFTTPTERENLDRLRQSQRGQLVEQVPQAPMAEVDPLLTPIPPTELSIQGYIQRSDGSQGTVWINHQPLREGSNNGQVQVGKVNSQGIPLTIQDNGHSVRLKAGQVFNPGTGEISERNVKATTPVSSVNPAEQGVIR